MNVPEINKRIEMLIEYYNNGNRNAFSRDIKISQPRINRLFSIDKRNNEIPKVSLEIIIAIINKFVDINSEWLITGRGNMIKSDTGSSSEDCEEFKDEIIKLQKRIIQLQDDRQALKKQDDEPDSMGQEKLKHNN